MLLSSTPDTADVNLPQMLETVSTVHAIKLSFIKVKLHTGSRHPQQ